MKKPKLLTASSILAFIFIFAMTGLDIVLSFLGWKPTFGDDILAGIIGFLPSVGSVSLSMLIGVTRSWKTKVLSSVIWLFCITISLTGNFLNMTARAFESLETEKIAEVEVVNVRDTNKEQIQIFKDANKEKLAIVDQEIANLNTLYKQAQESRDYQINDGVNRDGTMGPKARAFQASMDQISRDIEKKQQYKINLQDKATTALLEFQAKTAVNLSEANVELAETQNDMRGHMPVIRYFLPNKDHQRNAVLWGLGLFAAVISLAGPVVSYAMAVHLNHKKLRQADKLKKQSCKPVIPKPVKDIVHVKEHVSEPVIIEKTVVLEKLLPPEEEKDETLILPLTAESIEDYYSQDTRVDSLSTTPLSEAEKRRQRNRNNGYI
jgi:hypothetical protein